MSFLSRTVFVASFVALLAAGAGLTNRALADDAAPAAAPAGAAPAAAAAPAGDEKPYHIEADGTTDWPTFNGYRRYNAICYTCHGPDGAGGSFAPSLVDSLKTMTYDKFIETVVNGRTNVSTSNEKRMPALGTDPNVMCYINDIYAYLKARSDGAVGRGRPAKHVNKPQEAADEEAACMGPATGN